MSNKTNNQRLTGCLFGVLNCVCILPLWYILLYGILESIKAEPYMWTIYWVYVPGAFGFAVVTKIIEGLFGE